MKDQLLVKTMDVFQGLVTKLVRCKSIERALSPISSQVSLLIIILEQDKDDSQTVQASEDAEHNIVEPVLSVSICSQRLVEAVNGFISAGERQSQAIRDKEFSDQMSSACETLTLASDNLFIKAQRYESKHAPGSIKHTLCQAAKDVLQGILKVLLVKDDYYVRQLVQKTDSVLNLIRSIEREREKSDLISAFKAITFAVLAFKMELVKRCQNLCSKSCRDQIMIWMSVLQHSIPSLSKTSQTYLKYKGSVSAKTSRDSVMHEVVEACEKIKQLLQLGPQDQVEEGLTSFVAAVDKVIESLSEVNRGTLYPDVECDIVFMVQHSMYVAHFAWWAYRKLIVASCHRILQLKFRLLELNSALKEKPTLVQMRSEYEYVCEAMLDEVCDLEKHVNMTLLQLIIETFLCPLEKLATMKDVAGCKNKGRQFGDFQYNTLTEFSKYTDNLCQVSLLVASSSADSTKVREIVTSVRCLEYLEPDIAPAVIVLSKEPKNPAARKHLDLLLGRWAQEVCTVIDAVDTLVDPRVFMNVSENVLANEIDVFKSMHGSTHSDVHKHFHRFVNLSERPAVLAKKLLDENSDPVYRNGLNYFITSLFQRIREAKNVYLEIMQTKQPPIQQFDTLERRMKLVLQAVQMLREGLDVESHPHLLSAKRVRFKQRGLHSRPVKKSSHKEKTAEVKTGIVKADVKDPQSKDDVKTNPPLSGDASKDILHPELQREPPETETGTLIALPEIFSEKQLEGGPAAEIYQVVKQLLDACIQQDHKLVQNMTYNLQSWTNHIVENSQKLMLHCSHIPKVNELKNLLQKIDHTTPEIIQKAKFIIAGDKQSIHELIQDAMEWTEMVNSARMIIDVTADTWLTLTSDIQKSVETNSEHKLQILMSSIESAQKGMCQLLMKAQSLSGKYMENGVHKIGFLRDVHSEIENLTCTIKTSVDVALVSANRTPSDWWQLSVACRDWSVAMSCALSELDSISDKMETVGCGRFCGLRMKAAKKTTQTVQLLEEEMDCIMELVDCVAVGDVTLKARSDELVLKLQSALSDVLSVAKQPASSRSGPPDDHFSRLNFGLARSKWIEKAIDVQDMIRNNSCAYFGFAHQFLLNAQEVSLNEDLQDDVKTKERHKLGSEFLEKSQQLKQQVLRAIQLDPDLSKRAVIRSTLDTLSQLTSQIEGMLRTCPKLSDADVSSLSEKWAARMKKLVSHLKRMDGVKPSVVSEIERLNRASFGLHQYQDCIQKKKIGHPKCLSQLQPQQQHYTIEAQQHRQLQQHKQVPLRFQQQLPHHYEQNQQNLHSNHSQAQNMPQPRQDLSTNSSTEVSSANGLMAFDAETLSNTVTGWFIYGIYRKVSGDVSMYSPKGGAAQVVLTDAKYLRCRLKKWEETDNHHDSKVIQSALEMAHWCSEIALFTRGQGSLKDSEEVIGAAIAIFRHSSDLENFGRTLLSLAGNDRCAESLEACLSRMNTCASQLHIISSALYNSAKSYQGDRILMRNALNLLMAVRQMFSLAETLAAKGVREPPSSDEMTREVVSLLRRIQADNERYLRHERENTQVDDLGLRRMEHHNPPSLTSLVDLSDLIQSDSEELHSEAE